MYMNDQYIFHVLISYFVKERIITLKICFLLYNFVGKDYKFQYRLSSESKQSSNYKTWEAQSWRCVYYSR